MNDPQSPSALALESLAKETACYPHPHEHARLTRDITRRLEAEKPIYTPAEYAQRLCAMRRREWASNLTKAVHASGEIWIEPRDIRNVVAAIEDPRIDLPTLRTQLRQFLGARWREATSTADDTARLIIGDLREPQATSSLSLGQQRLLAETIAEAYSLDIHDAQTLVKREVSRLADANARSKRAQERQEKARARSRQWEENLVTFDALPAILEFSRRDVLRWLAENRLPIALRKRGPDGRETFLFDAGQILKLRPNLRPERATPRTKDTQAKKIKPLSGSSGNRSIARVAALDRFSAHFKTARAMTRRLTLVTGPTNSGKSYTALLALAEAESGLALAPLRLLAHEFYEMLLSRGVATSLITGEERIEDPTARHIAATVEMCPMRHPVDVALIDEAQMLSDADRGAAWTAAIMGVPARHVYILGSPECIPLIRRIAELCGDTLDEIELQRKSPLGVAASPLHLTELTRGDAVIAFSRRDVLNIRSELQTRNRRVAVVYGALSPEVRRAEAARFNAGDADILVATDAIGMGLNLSIKRVVFSTLNKFDGSHTRSLTSQEIKQIGGRAGRYGRHEGGIVTALHGAGSMNYLNKMLHAAPMPSHDLRPLVQPDADIVCAVAREIQSESLYEVLTRIEQAVLRRDDPNYRLGDMRQAVEIAASLEGVEGLDLVTRWVYAMCPVDQRDNGILRLMDWAADHAASRRVAPPGLGRMSAPHLARKDELERAEKRYKRLVAWRWLSQRFPETYADQQAAESYSETLNEWIESVLRQQARPREGAEPAKKAHRGKNHKKGKRRTNPQYAH